MRVFSTSSEILVADFPHWLVSFYRWPLFFAVVRMKNRSEERNPTAKLADSSPGDRRLRTRLGIRLLLATAKVLIRLVQSIERAFGLPPEAAEKALKRFTTQTGIKTDPVYSSDWTGRPGRWQRKRFFRPE